MNYLVTGGAGFIGSNLVNRLVTEGNHITIIDEVDVERLLMMKLVDTLLSRRTLKI